MFTNSNLEITIREDKVLNYAEADFVGNLDSYNLKEKRHVIMESVETFNKKYLVFNFLNLVFINSESISFLVQIHELLQKKDKVLVIINAKKNVVDVLKVIGIFEQIPYYNNLQEFIKTI